MEEEHEVKKKKQGNNVQTWGNATTMNINSMIHTNILSSPYFKKNLFTLKTYHEVVDEIYYKVAHLEPWEKGSRKTSGQVGMCGGVRGVGAGGIVSSCFCLLFKLFTLKLTRKQLKGLIDHCDSPYIRGIGFMYIRYCIQPKDMWSWMEPYLEDEEELDVKAGGGCTMTVGQLVRSFLLRLEWYGTLFPRIPVPVEKEIRELLTELNLCDDHKRKADDGWGEAERHSRSKREDENELRAMPDNDFGEAEKFARLHHQSRERSRERPARGDESKHVRRSRSPDRSRVKPNRMGGDSNWERRRGRSRDLSRERVSRGGMDHYKELPPRRSRSRDRIRQRPDRSNRSRERSRDRSFKNGKDRSHRSRSRERSSEDKHGGVHRSHSRERGAGEKRDKSYSGNSKDHVVKDRKGHSQRHNERVRYRSRTRSRERRKGRSRSKEHSKEREYSEKKRRILRENSPIKVGDDGKEKRKEAFHEPNNTKKVHETDLENPLVTSDRSHNKQSENSRDQGNESDKNIDGGLKSDEGSVELEAGELRDDERASQKHKKKKKKKDREEKKQKVRNKDEETVTKKHKSKKSKRKHKDTEYSDHGI